MNTRFANDPPVIPERVHDHVRMTMKASMAEALRGEFSYTRGRLPRVWENFHRDTEIAGLFRYFWEHDLVRADEQPDDLCTGDLFGDCFDESHADTIPGGLRELRAQESRAVHKLETEGQWYILGEYKRAVFDTAYDDWCWETVDSIGSFVGDDFYGSGYESDVYLNTLAGLFDSRGLILDGYFYTKTGEWMRQAQATWGMYAAMHGEVA